MATTGIRHAITVVSPDVKRSAVCSDIDSKVSNVLGLDSAVGTALWVPCGEVSGFSISEFDGLIFRVPAQISFISHHRGTRWYPTHLVKLSILTLGCVTTNFLSDGGGAFARTSAQKTSQHCVHRGFAGSFLLKSPQVRSGPYLSYILCAPPVLLLSHVRSVLMFNVSGSGRAETFVKRSNASSVQG